MTTDNVILVRLRRPEPGRVQARRRAVQRGAVRHRPDEGRRRLPQLHQRRPRGVLRGRPLGRGLGSHGRRGARDPRAASGRPVLSDQAPEPGWAAAPTGGPPAHVRSEVRGGRHVDAVIDNLPLYWEGFRTTLALTLISGGDRTGVGTILGAFRVSPVAPLRWFGTTYVELVRNTPLTLVFIFFVFVAPQLGITADFFVSAVMCAVGLHRGVRLRGGALRRQQRRRRPGRGGAGGRADVQPDPAGHRAAAGVPHGDPAVDQHLHRADQEQLGRRRLLRRRAVRRRQAAGHRPTRPTSSRSWSVSPSSTSSSPFRPGSWPVGSSGGWRSPDELGPLRRSRAAGPPPRADLVPSSPALILLAVLLVYVPPARQP